jgi:hypothetical protein
MDSGTRQPIHGANVALEDDLTVMVQTNADGQFILPKLRNYHLAAETFLGSGIPFGDIYNEVIVVTHPHYRSKKASSMSQAPKRKKRSEALQFKDILMTRNNSH